MFSPRSNGGAVIENLVGRQRTMDHRCPHCDATIPSGTFRLAPDWCPECRRSLHPIAAPLFSSVCRSFVRHWLKLGIIATILAISWGSLAGYQRAAARQSLQQALGALDPVWRIQLKPMNPDLPPDIKVGYWQFVANPFRDEVWVEYDFSTGGSGSAWFSLSNWHEVTNP